LIIGLNRSAIGTVVERTSRFTVLLHLPRKIGYGTIPPVKNGPALSGYGSEAVRDALTKALVPLPEHLRRSLTWTEGRKWRDTRTSPRPPGSVSTSATLTVRGSVGRTKIRMVFCDNIFRRALTCPDMIDVKSMQSLTPSTIGLAKNSNG
jgi:hypothetical protein